MQPGEKCWSFDSLPLEGQSGKQRSDNSRDLKRLIWFTGKLMMMIMMMLLPSSSAPNNSALLQIEGDTSEHSSTGNIGGMAYAAVISLKHYLELEFLGAINRREVVKELQSLAETLRRLDGAINRRNPVAINTLDAQIREAVWKLDDLAESLVLYRAPPPSYGKYRSRDHVKYLSRDQPFVDEEKVKQEVYTFLETAKQLREEYTRELNRPVPREEEEYDLVSPTDDFGVKKSTTTIGLSDQIDNIIYEFVDPHSELKTISIFGMAGIGKTHLAREIYQHPIIRQHFGLLVWVSLGPQQQQLKHVWAGIVAELERKPKKLYLETNIMTLVQLVQRGLLGRRYLIVLDDVWSTAGLTSLLRLLRVEGNGGRVLLSSRLEQVAKDLETSIHKIRFLNNEESWDLLWKNVFGDKSPFPPPQLEKAGKKIAEKCEGLPLLVLAVADILSGEDKTEEYWNKVADKKTTTFPDAYDRISEVLFSSYEYLPQYLKPCFLYMGVFPQSSEIPLSKLINLLIVEDFMESELFPTTVFTQKRVKPKPHNSVPKNTRLTLFQPERQSLPTVPKNSKGFVLPKATCEAMRTPPSPCRFQKAFETLYLLEPGPSLTRFITPFEKIDLLGRKPYREIFFWPSRENGSLRKQQALTRVAAPSRKHGSVEPDWFQNGGVDTIATSELFLMECVEKLVSNSLAIICMHSSRERIKSCKLHSAYWYLCFKEARKNKFLLVMKKLGDASKEHMERQRCLSVQNNILFGIKEVYDSMASASLRTRSLLCTGEDHEYPVPICLNMMLLKVLDALAIRFYEFPNEVSELVRLRYLSLTYNGKLSPSISKLQQLQFMIVRQHHNIKLLRDPTYLPEQIWDLQKLTHLRIMGSNVPDPSLSKKLPNLYALHMNAHSCTEAVFRGIPSLKKLGIRIELQPDSVQIITCFEHIEVLDELESLKCVVVNPRLKTQPLSPPGHLSKFPKCLTKLCLNGLGYSWKYMSAIGSLPYLKVLKLRFSAFRGAEWETKVGEFQRLQFLLLEDIDVVHWTTDDDGDACFPRLRRLIIRHCYRLKEIPQTIPALESLEVVDCSPAVVASARQVQEERNACVEVMIKSSWNL